MKTKGDIATGRTNSVRAFSLPLGPAAAGTILISPGTPVKVCLGKTNWVVAEGSLPCDAGWIQNILQRNEAKGTVAAENGQ